MHRSAALFPPLKPSARVACTVVAATCAAGVNIGLLEVFDQASSERWLVATPQILEAKAHCDALPERDARTRCAQDMVARTLALAAHGKRVASR